MHTTDYKKQADLLLSALPLVAKENCFALHGGTAINLFLSDMSRLSVDVDLTYLPIEDRVTSMANINAALHRIEQQIMAFLPDMFVQHRQQEANLQE
jgi:predicted nucleotidyltransferase component of viral defense system